MQSLEALIINEKYVLFFKNKFYSAIAFLLLAMFAWNLVGAESSLSSETVNHISRLRLQRSLTIDQAMSIFTKAGEIRREIIIKSDLIIRGDQLRNPELVDVLMQKGGNITDWAKYSTKSIPSPSGSF